MVGGDRDDTVTAGWIDLTGKGLQCRFDVIRILFRIRYGDIGMGIDPAFPQAGFNQHSGYGLFSNVDTKYFSAHWVSQLKTLHDHLPDSGFGARCTTAITDDWMSLREAVD